MGSRANDSALRRTIVRIHGNSGFDIGANVHGENPKQMDDQIKPPANVVLNQFQFLLRARTGSSSFWAVTQVVGHSNVTDGIMMTASNRWFDTVEMAPDKDGVAHDV